MLASTGIVAHLLQCNRAVNRNSPSDEPPGIPGVVEHAKPSYSQMTPWPVGLSPTHVHKRTY